jgi:hypothetical protein
LDLKVTRGREVAAAEDVSSTGQRGNSKDIDAREFGEIGRKEEKV